MKKTTLATAFLFMAAALVLGASGKHGHGGGGGGAAPCTRLPLRATRPAVEVQAAVPGELLLILLHLFKPILSIPSSIPSEHRLRSYLTSRLM